MKLVLIWCMVMSCLDFRATISEGLDPANMLLCTSLCREELTRALEDDLNCYGSGIVSLNYLKVIIDGSTNISPRIQQFSDFQQGTIQELVLPFGKHLVRVEDRMRNFPYALYDSQEVMVMNIFNSGKARFRSTLV